MDTIRVQPHTEDDEEEDSLLPPPMTPKRPGNVTVVLGVVAVVVIGLLLLVAAFTWIFSGPEQTAETQNQTQTAPATTVPSQTAAVPITCPAFTTEKQMCELPKAGAWISTGGTPGFHTCRTPSSDSLFASMDYLDDSSTGPHPYSKDAAGVTNIHYVPKRQGLMLTYWLSESPCP